MKILKKTIDVLIVSIPVTFSTYPPAAPGILISMLKHYGYTSAFYDFNAYARDDADVQNFAINQDTPSDLTNLNSLMMYHVNKILEYNPKFVGLSVFTYQCTQIAKLLCIYLKLHAPDVKIIVGGQGLPTGGINGKNIGSVWEELKICDYWVISEGEYPIVDIVSGKFKNKDTWTQIDNLDEFPNPDYSSYDWSLYLRTLPITGSRGCVRRCTFCDIHQHWKKYVFRSGKSIAREMIEQSEKYNINYFEFTDSLINGSMKAYKDLINVLAEYNSKTDKKITWGGQFIFRPKNQFPEDVWELSARAGLTEVKVGIESLSESVRDHMLKKFSNDDIRYGLRCMKKYGVLGKFLMIVGYVTDTEETIAENKDMYTELVEYANNTITEVSIGTTLGILPGTPLETMSKELNITLSDQENAWIGTSTLTTRLQWRKDLINHATELGYYVPENDEQQVFINKLESQYA